MPAVPRPAAAPCVGTLGQEEVRVSSRIRDFSARQPPSRGRRSRCSVLGDSLRRSSTTWHAAAAGGSSPHAARPGAEVVSDYLPVLGRELQACLRWRNTLNVPGTSTPMLLARSRHASVRSLERYARPGVDAVARHVAERDPAARRRT